MLSVDGTVAPEGYEMMNRNKRTPKKVRRCARRPLYYVLQMSL